MLSYLETYIAAQKTIGIYFIFLGVVLLALAISIKFAKNTFFANGLILSAILCGIGMIASGIGYRITETRLMNEQIQLFHKDSNTFKEVEKERMTKVVKNNALYKIIPLALIFFSFLFIWIVKSPFWQGMAFSFIIMLIGFIIVEFFSKDSVNSYYQVLSGK